MHLAPFFLESIISKLGILVIKEGMDHALQEGISNLVVKSDAKTLIKILNLKEEPPWNLIMCVK